MLVTTPVTVTADFIHSRDQGLPIRVPKDLLAPIILDSHLLDLIRINPTHTVEISNNISALFTSVKLF